MGLFDKFKKKEQVVNEEIKKQLPYNIVFNTTADGRLQVDFYDENADFKQFYDTTRLVIGNNTKNIEGYNLQSALVSWYSMSDAVIVNEYGQETGRRNDYKEILTQIDLNLLQSDSNYCVAVMGRLLDKKRVDKYLEDGLKENSILECGNYVGSIERKENKYTKCYNVNIGKAVHNSGFMIQKRNENRMQDEERRQRSIEDKQRRIDMLKQEIEELSK